MTDGQITDREKVRVESNSIRKDSPQARGSAAEDKKEWPLRKENKKIEEERRTIKENKDEKLRSAEVWIYNLMMIWLHV